MENKSIMKDENTLIPKKIHYCWFGGKPLNKIGQKCFASWKKYFPDYEIIEWNESNFDFNCCQYVKEAYEAKKWAFVSDYARYKILYEQGGIYFDTDVEVIKPFDDILSKGAFMGCENQAENSKIAVASGLGCGCQAGLEFYSKILQDYEKNSFYNKDGSLNLYTIVDRTTDILRECGLEDTTKVQKVADITIYPAEYFCPIDLETGKLNKTKNTYSIHHYSASWVDNKSKFRGKVYQFINRTFGQKTANFFRKLLGKK